MRDFLTLTTGVPVNVDLAPNDPIPTQNALIHVYLFRVEVNPFFENNPPIRPDSTTIQEPPLGLNLQYLITPYGPNQQEIQLTLGEVMSVFHQTRIIPQASLDISIQDLTEELRVVPLSLSLDQMSELWRAFDGRSYRLSVAYEVSAVVVDNPVAQQVVPVEERSVDVGTLR